MLKSFAKINSASTTRILYSCRLFFEIPKDSLLKDYTLNPLIYVSAHHSRADMSE